MDLDNNRTFLLLVRLGIGSNKNASFPERIDWEAIQALAEQQGLSAVVLDGVEELRKQGESHILPEKNVLKPWIGRVLQSYEFRYEKYRRIIAEMARFFNQHNVKMMVLKGFACSLDWPRPNHRPSGDIDIWQFGKQKEADELLKSEKGIEVDTSEHHHTVFHWHDFMVENHYDLLIPTAARANKTLEPILKDLAMDDSRFTELYGEKVFLPSSNFNALFLLRHMLMHFVAVGINFRQILDWAFFWEKHGDEVNVEWLNDLLEKNSMSSFFNIINAICVEDLGFSPSIFPSVQYYPQLKDRVVDDILHPEFNKLDAHQPRLLSRIIFKFKRWKAGQWKRELCYDEDSWTAFWTSVWSHLLKPRSI